MSMKLKLEGMGVIFNLILSACVSFFFPFYKLILHSFHFDVAKKEVFQDTRAGAAAFNHSATVLCKCVWFHKGGFTFISTVGQVT